MILTSWEVDEYDWDNVEGEEEEEEEDEEEERQLEEQGVREVCPHQDRAKQLHRLQHVLVMVQEGPVVYYQTE